MAPDDVAERDRAVVAPLGIPAGVAPGDDLAALIAERPDVGALQDGDAIVISQKIVSKAEDCYVRLDDAVVDERARTLADACGKDPRFVATVLSETETEATPAETARIQQCISAWPNNTVGHTRW